jgi:hypothetical protein
MMYVYLRCVSLYRFSATVRRKKLHVCKRDACLKSTLSIYQEALQQHHPCENMLQMKKAIYFNVECRTVKKNM